VTQLVEELLRVALGDAVVALFDGCSRPRAQERPVARRSAARNRHGCRKWDIVDRPALCHGLALHDPGIEPL
jgi:hypothetical protein